MDYVIFFGVLTLAACGGSLLAAGIVYAAFGKFISFERFK